MNKDLLYLVFLVCFACRSTIDAPPPRPNLIFIMADDLGYGDIEPYGQEKISTPSLSQLARKGLTFTQFYAGTSVCAPSRAVLMTGLHTGHVEIRGNKQYRIRNGQHPLSPGIPTLASVCKEAGYQTGMIGKWGLGDPNTMGKPSNHGFNYFFGYTDQVLAHNYWPEYLWRNDEKVFLENEVNYLDTSAWHDGLGSYSTVKKDYSHDLFMAEAQDFIERNQDTSFFLYLPLTIPHDNGEQIDSMVFEVPSQGKYAQEAWHKKERDYAAMITRMDEGIGQIMDLLDDLSLREKTLIFFTSDNGPMRQNETTAFFDSNGPLRGGKRDLYEGGIRVPMIVSWPGIIPGGGRSTHPGAFWDILPTVADLLSVELPAQIDGLSFLPILLLKGDQKVHNYLYWEFHEGSGSQAIRMGDLKGVRNNMNAWPNTTWEIFDLAEDPSERSDIAADRSDILATFDSLALAARTSSTLFPFPID